MRIATWNVNSLKARLEKVGWWLERAQPDVLLMQETKLSDGDAPHAQLERWGYSLVHHGQGRWNGVAIASRVPATDLVQNFGEPLMPSALETEDAPAAEARMIAATVDGIRLVSIYAPNGRALGTPFYQAKLDWFRRLSSWLARAQSPNDALVIGGDFNIAPSDADVWDPAACNGGTHVSPDERAAFMRLCDWGLVDAYRRQNRATERFTWWDYRAGNFQKNFGMRIDLCLISPPLVPRLVWSEIDREARKGKPIPSDHAPVIIDLDVPGRPLDAGWKSAEARIAERRR